tara:strand:- start:528 stop:995 length:468 start_codon:yes stop_codon:yes gene_type:complete
MSEIIKENKQAPSFNLPRDGGGKINSEDLKGKNIVLYFYPKDDTPGCTTEGKDFTAHYDEFQKLNTEIIGVSKDSVKSHDKFVCKYDFKFPLISDEELELCNKYGVWLEKAMYGKKYMGIERSTFLIDDKGIIKKIWRKVKVTDHVKEVLAELSS